MPSVTDRLLIMYGNLPRQLFFVAEVVYVMGFFYMTDVNNYLLVNYIMLISPDIYF